MEKLVACRIAAIELYFLSPPPPPPFVSKSLLAGEQIHDADHDLNDLNFSLAISRVLHY